MLQLLLSPEDRMKELVGKYVVVTKSRKNNEFLFYVDKQLAEVVSSKWWSTFLENAKGFYSTTEALNFSKSLRFNNPMVYEVIDTGLSDFGGTIYDIKKLSKGDEDE